jgi:hypothetical protein
MTAEYGSRLTAVRWSRAVPSLRQKILEAIGTQVDFKVSRKVPGLWARQNLTFTPQKDFQFLGQVFHKGVSATVDLSGFLQPNVEYACSSCVEHAKAFEFHFRGSSPSELDADIRTFFTEIVPFVDSNIKDQNITPPLADHLHIVAKKPEDFIQRMQAAGVSRTGIVRSLVAYHSLVELQMMLTDWANKTRLMSEHYTEPSRPPLMSFLQLKKMKSLIHFYESIVDGKNLDLNLYSDEATDLKKNNAGARWGSTYSDHNLWGIELRFPSYEKSKAYVKLANGIKRTLDDQDFQISIEQAKAMEKLSEEKFISQLWFSLRASENIKNFADPYIRALASRVFDKIGGDAGFIAKTRTSLEASYYILCFFDWSQNPLFLNQKDRRERILRAQKFLFEHIIEAKQFKIADFDLFFESSGLNELLNEVVVRGEH